MSSNHLSIEPAQPENAHNHHSCLIEGCPLCYPKIEELKPDGVIEGWEDKLDNQLCVLGQVINMGNKPFFPWIIDDVKDLLQQQAQKSYSQGREDGIRECLVSPEKVLVANKGSGMTVGLDEAICILNKLLNQKQDEQRN